MTDPSRWQQIEDLYHAALECAPSQRTALLERADPELRREVESLLAQGSATVHADFGSGLRAVALIAGAIALIVVAGRYLLNPFFRLLAQTGSREVMTAAALLVVLGAALIMQNAGMSMALGAFLAGVLLVVSERRLKRVVSQE